MPAHTWSWRHPFAVALFLEARLRACGTSTALFLSPSLFSFFLLPSSLSVIHSMSSVCIGSSKTDNDCSCEQFIPKKAKLSRCKTCSHRRTAHSGIPPAPSDDTTNPLSKPVVNYGGRVLDSYEATAAVVKARKEMLSGYRTPLNEVRAMSPYPPQADISSPHQSMKGKGKSIRCPSSRISSQNKNTGLGKIGRIVFFPCGDQVFSFLRTSTRLVVSSNTYQGISQFEKPTINSDTLQPWINAGLAVEAPAAGDAGITFQLEWGSKQFNAFLRDLFPTLFAHLEIAYPAIGTLPNEPDTVGKKRVEYSLPYVLLFKERKKYHVVDATHPNAIKYMEVANGWKDGPKDSSKKNSSFRAKSLFFGAHPYYILMKNLR